MYRKPQAVLANVWPLYVSKFLDYLQTSGQVLNFPWSLEAYQGWGERITAEQINQNWLRAHVSFQGAADFAE